MTYRIRVKALNNKILSFKNVTHYKAEHGLIYFTDSITKKPKTFAVSNCEIEEEVNTPKEVKQ